jgi:hypothetical protein
MGVAVTTTAAAMNGIQESLLQLNAMLVRIVANQDKMLVDLKKTTAALTIQRSNATTRSRFMAGQASPQLGMKPSSHKVPCTAVTRMLPVFVFPLPSLPRRPQGVRHWAAMSAATMQLSRFSPGETQ